MNRRALQNLSTLLRLTEKDPPEFRFEALLAGARTHLILYSQEADAAGVEIYREIVAVLEASGSWEHVKELVNVNSRV